MKTPFNFLTANGPVWFTEDYGVIAADLKNTDWEQRVLVSAFQRFVEVYPRPFGTYMVHSKQKGAKVLTSVEPMTY